MNTFLWVVIALITFVALYFTSVRWLINSQSVSEKTREFLQFLLHYAIVFVVMVFVLYSVKLGDSSENWQLGLLPVLTVAFMTLFFYFAPTFLLAYLLYPFKYTKKRSKFSIWLLIVVAAICLILTIVFFVTISFSNM